MDLSKKEASSYNLFDAAGVGLIGLDADGRIVRHNEMALDYLSIEAESLLGKEVETLQSAITSPEFFDSLKNPDPFYCLVPGTNRLLVAVCSPLQGAGEDTAVFMIMIRPYGLDRQFIRMRSDLSRNVVLEINSLLNSVAIASEIILEPDLHEEKATRERFLSSFSRDISDLGDFFYGLQEITDPVPFPNRVHSTPLNWKTLIEDLIQKTRGLGNERNVSLSSDIPAALGSPEGDYHWLYLAVFTVLSHAVNSASPLSEVRIASRAGDGTLETIVEYEVDKAAGEADPWPPRTLFPFSGEEFAVDVFAISNFAVAQSILLLHRGELHREDGEKVRFSVRLPL